MRGFHRQGLRGVMAIHGHGSDLPVTPLLTELANELPGPGREWHVWFEEPEYVGVAERHHLRPEHASWMEAFAFNRGG